MAQERAFLDSLRRTVHYHADGQQLVLETHFINATDKPVTAHGSLKMHLAKAGSVTILRDGVRVSDVRRQSLSP